MKGLNHALIIMLIFVGIKQTQAQILGIQAGTNYNKFYDRMDVGGYNSSIYKGKWGFQAGITLSKLKIDTVFNLRFGLLYEEFGGDFTIKTGTHTSSLTSMGSVLKRNLALQFYPLNASIRNFNLGAGLQVNAMISNKLSGTQSGWSGNDTITNFQNDLVAKDFIKPFNTAAIGYINFELQLASGVLNLEYAFIWNFSNEFINYSTKTYRHQLSLIYSFYSFRK